MDIKCKFSLNFHSVAEGKVYLCDVTSKATGGDAREVKSVTGQHMAEKSDENVVAVYFPDGSFVGFPMNLPAFFPQMISLVISGCRITELTRQDLSGLQQLQCLSVINNSLTKLPNNLFMDTPNLRIIKFYGNKIEKLSSRLLNCLNWKILEQIDFRANVTIDEVFKRGSTYILTDDVARNFKHMCHSTLSSFRTVIDECCSYDEEDDEKKNGDLLLTGEGSDFSILVEGVKVRVHKNILAQHSSVFAAMFEHDMEENRSNELLVIDFSADVVQDMIRFIYTGKVSSLDNVVELHSISSQYWIVGLQQLCEETIIENIDESNMIEVLRIGCMYSSRPMKQSAFYKISEIFTLRQLDEKLMEQPDKLEKLLKLKRKFDADYADIMSE